MGVTCSIQVDEKNTFIILFGRPEVKRSHFKPRSTWEDNIKTDVKERDSESISWIQLTQDEVQ